RIAVVLGAAHPADPAVGQQLDVERARGRAVVRADRMTDADFGVNVHEGAFLAICTTLPEFGALAKGSDPFYSSDLPERQIGSTRLCAALGKHAVHLAAMVCLVVEHVRHEQARGLGYLALGGTGEPGEVSFQPGGIELLGPADDDLVERRALALQVLPALVHVERVGDPGCLGPRRAGEAAHPDLVTPHEMVERAVDGAEEGAALSFAHLVAQDLRRAVEVLVLPAVVGGHRAHVCRCDHRSLPMLSSRRLSPGSTSPKVSGAGGWLDPGHKARDDKLAHDLVRLEVERDLDGGVLHAVGAVHRIALAALGQLLADAAGRRRGRIGAP